MLQLTAATFILGLFGLTAALEAPPRPFYDSLACDGHLVYFDYSSCPHHDNSWKPTARSFGAEGNADYQPGFAGAPNTICITSERFDGYLYIDRNGAGTNQQTVRISVDSTLRGDKTYGSAWVQSRSDDHIGHEGTRGKLPVITPLAKFRFSDTSPQPGKGLTGASSANDVIYTHTRKVAMYIDYCSANNA